MSARLVLLAALAALAALPSCAKDVVLPDQGGQASCGDGVVQSGEACDVQSPGCSACLVVPGWACPGNACAPICGDGVVGGGASCGDARRATACDMTGYWAVRETDYERDAVLQGLQTASQWYLYRFVQSGDRFTTVEELDCGVHVTGSATIDYAADSLRAMVYDNAMDGSGPGGARQGTSVASASGCAVSLDRWYFARGVAAGYLPADFASGAPLSSLPPLPSVNDPVNGVDAPAGATDPDGDGFPGVAFALTGIFPGTRDDAQRTWKQYATTGSPVASAALTFAVPGSLDVEDHVLHVSQCTACDLIASGSTVATDLPARATFAFVGASPGGARVSTVVVNTPRRSLDDDLSTCAHVRLLLPHDPTPPPGAH